MPEMPSQVIFSICSSDMWSCSFMYFLPSGVLNRRSRRWLSSSSMAMAMSVFFTL